MHNHYLSIFMGGDVYGESGLQILESHFNDFKSQNSIDFAIINGENAANGFGILEKDAQRIFSSGIDVITGGNHSLEKRDVWEYLNNNNNMLRPANYPQNVNVLNKHLKNDTLLFAPGIGLGFYQRDTIVIAVLNLQGRENLYNIDCPFTYAMTAIEHIKQKTNIILIDFHAESNEEKEALAIYLDGNISALCGTHTHIQTADERILRQGTAYITDLGMTGSNDSVIGSKADLAIKRNITQVPYKMEASEEKAHIQGVIIQIDTQTGKAYSIKRISIP